MYAAIQVTFSLYISVVPLEVYQMLSVAWLMSVLPLRTMHLLMTFDIAVWRAEVWRTTPGKFMTSSGYYLTTTGEHKVVRESMVKLWQLNLGSGRKCWRQHFVPLLSSPMNCKHRAILLSWGSLLTWISGIHSPIYTSIMKQDMNVVKDLLSNAVPLINWTLF